MKYVVMAGFLVACTLVTPLIVWAQSGWRAAFEAWRAFSIWFFGLLLVAGIAALLMLIP